MCTRGHISVWYWRSLWCALYKNASPQGGVQFGSCSEWSNVEGIIPPYRSIIRKSVDLVIFRRHPCPNWSPSSPRHYRLRLHAHSALHRPQRPTPLLSSISWPLLARHRALRHIFLRRQLSARRRCGRRRGLKHEEVARHGWCEVCQGQFRGVWCCYIYVSFRKNQPSQQLLGREMSKRKRKTYSQTPRKTPWPARLHVPRPATQSGRRRPKRPSLIPAWRG